MKKTVVLIPCYNESMTIGKVVADYRQVLPDAQIIVCDNNSSDGTDEIAKSAGATVIYELKQGKGNAVRKMFREIEADCYIMVDGDDTYPAEYAPQMAEMILSGQADMVNGDRLSATYFNENKRPFHNLGNKLVRNLINYIFHGNVKDIMTGYRAFSRQFVKGFPVISKGFEIETEMTIHALDKNLMICEIPVDYRDRPVGSESKLNTIPDGIKVLKMIFRLFRDYKPLSFFSWCAFGLLAISLFMFLPVLNEYIQTGLVPRFPTLIVSVFIALAALLFYLCGLILQVISNKHKQLYEIQMNLMQMMFKQSEDT